MRIDEFWIPKLYEKYYYVCSLDSNNDNDNVKEIPFMNDRLDYDNYVNGNMFKDKRDALLESRKKLIKISKILKNKNEKGDN